MARRRCRAAAGCRRPVLLRSQPRTVPRSSGKILWVKEQSAGEYVVFALPAAARASRPQ
jgi:hypothetical protein